MPKSINKWHAQHMLGRTRADTHKYGLDKNAKII